MPVSTLSPEPERIIAEDIERVLPHIADIALRPDMRFFITGGTGFVLYPAQME